MYNGETTLKLMFPERVIDLTKRFNLRIREVKRNSPQLVSNYVSFLYTDGKRAVDNNFSSFIWSFECNFYTEGNLFYHTELDELFNMIYQRKAYYIWHDKTPGKKYLVNPLALDATRKAADRGTFTLQFEVFKGFGESLGSTMSDFTTDEAMWQFGQGIASKDYKYKFSTNEFTVYNAGNFLINPRAHYLKILIETQNSGELRIDNQTTGDRFIYYPEMSVTDSLLIDGSEPKMNGTKCGRDTNHGLINLAVGENKIKISNTSKILSVWDFFYLYK
ncbi:phage tail family protein [Listeria monocytogenes]|uniref:phage tail domain-containing protein n=1 Tax=Listeria monocytogenes TaxID=1639 RepID=UPI000F19D113|nr:phage tail domain-containing protein [Listeria monocytogenes]EAD1189288.1 phage tail family protein [Listeria monocytogenes]EAD9073483.1 phage tail family protein [Listeria monocytogenes]EAE3694164.1 phage tail family protein [Listeria monocytogenes]EAF3625766.1 phage tail family protein [Listeria monocytogenes]EAF4063395.1 phage tail family protein [Listeria monocytogenes]